MDLMRKQLEAGKLKVVVGIATIETLEAKVSMWASEVVAVGANTWAFGVAAVAQQGVSMWA